MEENKGKLTLTEMMKLAEKIPTPDWKVIGGENLVGSIEGIEVTIYPFVEYYAIKAKKGDILLGNVTDGPSDFGYLRYSGTRCYSRNRRPDNKRNTGLSTFYRKIYDSKKGDKGVQSAIEEARRLISE